MKLYLYHSRSIEITWILVSHTACTLTSKVKHAMQIFLFESYLNLLVVDGSVWKYILLAITYSASYAN